ncbi:MAG: hypothetical protein R6X27_16085 [Candidatus Desulfacyla sp.]
MTETSCFQAVGFCHLDIRYSYLFRISKFDIRVLAEQGFPFSHELTNNRNILDRRAIFGAKDRPDPEGFLKDVRNLMLIFS